MKEEEVYTPRVYAYLRYSTMKQDEKEQQHIIQNYCKYHRLEIDEIVSDVAVSGKTSWTDRNLADLVARMRPGDIIIVSEASRLSRSMADFSEFLNRAMRKIKGRIIVCNQNMDIDCGNLTAIVEMQLQMLMFAAQMERELISGRTAAALAARREQARSYGGWTSKAGNWCTRIGKAGGELTESEKKNRRTNKRAKMEVRVPEATKQILEMHRLGISNRAIARKLNEQGLTTESGRPWHDTKVGRIINLYADEIIG